MVLIPGHIVLFDINNAEHGHQYFSKSISLTDAYVCTGMICASRYPELFNYNPSPRRYQDGLETEDPDLVTTFIIQ